jgi:aminoacylase
MRDKEEKRLKSDSKLSIGDVTTVNLTVIEGGVQPNVIPPEFKAKFDMRITPSMNLVELESRINSWCELAGEGVSLKFIQKNSIQAVTSTAPDDPWWSAFSGAINDLKLLTKVEIFPAATDSRYLRAVGYPAIGFSPMNHTPVLLHDHNEFLNRDVFLRGIDIYTKIIDKLANVPKKEA